MEPRIRTVRAIAGLLLVIACGDDQAPGSPSLGLGVDPGSVNVEVGASGSATATLSRSGGFRGTVSLAAQGAPDGMTVGFNPATVPAAETASTVEIVAAITVAPGTYPLTITATAPGVPDASDELTVVVITTAAGYRAHPRATR